MNIIENSCYFLVITTIFFKILLKPAQDYEKYLCKIDINRLIKRWDDIDRQKID